MNANESGERPAMTGQRIVIEQREPRRRRGVVFLLLFSVMLNLVLFAGRSGLGLNRLDERYVAGTPLVGPKIAVVEVVGTIGDSSVEYILKQIRQARDDSQVKGVVLRVDSPGGTVSGSDEIWREVATLKARDKPVVASFGGMAASGGYYVSAPADLIFAEPTTLTGSIGVKMEILQLEGLMKKIGVDYATITTGEWKNSASMYKNLTDTERARWREVLEAAHQRFVRVVAQGRKLGISQALALSNGKVYTTDEAKALKLIDRIGYLDDAIAHVQTQLNLESARVIRYSKPVSLSDVLLSTTAQAKQAPLDAEMLDRLRTPQILYIAH